MRDWKVSKFLTSSLVVGVNSKPSLPGKEEDAVTSVGGRDARSRKYGREDFVAETLQVNAHRVENQPVIPTNETAHVLAHDPCGHNLRYDSKHFRP